MLLPTRSKLLCSSFRSWWKPLHAVLNDGAGVWTTWSSCLRRSRPAGSAEILVLSNLMQASCTKWSRPKMDAIYGRIQFWFPFSGTWASSLYGYIYTPSILEKNVILDKIWVKHWEHKSWIIFKLLSFKIQKKYMNRFVLKNTFIKYKYITLR